MKLHHSAFFSPRPALWLCLLGLVFRLAALAAVTAGSPDGNLAAVLDDRGGNLTYTVLYRGATVIETSALGVTVNGTNLASGVTITGAASYGTNEVFASRHGIHALATNLYQARQITLRHPASGLSYLVNVRVFNRGVAFRYELPDATAKTITAEASGFVLPVGSTVWVDTNASNYERFFVPMDIAACPANVGFGPPVTVQLAGTNGFLALTESTLGGFGNPFLARVPDATGRQLAVQYPVNQDGSIGMVATGPVTTPWNIILVGAELDQLVNNDLVESLAPPPDASLFPAGAATAWAAPGRSVWDWLRPQSGGITATNAMLNSLWASRLGFEYNTIDEGWAAWTNAAGAVDPWPLVRQVVDYSRPLGVKILIWKRSAELNTQAQRTAFFQQLNAVGAAGFKADFFDFNSVSCAARERVKLQEDILREAATYHLLANFHGSAKPSGQFRTYPNLLNFEAVFGKEQWPNPWMVVSVPCFRFLAGPADFTPLEFGGNPAFEIANAINMPGPLITYAERSDVIAKSPFASLIRALPCQWDETRVLPQTRLGETTATLRRKGAEWFIGIMNATVTNGWTLPLAFLDANVTYQADLVRQDSTVLERTNVTRESLLAVTITSTNGSGFAARLYPVPVFSAGANVLLTGTIIGTTGAWGGSGNTREKVFDGSFSTAFDSPNANGNWVGLDLGSDNRKTLKLIRYCPRYNWGTRLVSGVFQGANTADFSDAVNLYTVGYNPPEGAFTTVAVSNRTVFRYLRYLSPSGGYCNIAEAQFYGTATPDAPAEVTAAAGLNQAVLQWPAVPNATGYNLKRSIASGGPYVTVAAAVTATGCTNVGLSNGTNYYYVVTAVNADGESDNSAEVTVQPGGYAAWQRGFEPLGYWRLNETAGLTAADASGNGLAGQYQAAVAQGVPGPPNPPYAGLATDTRAAACTGQANSWVVLPGLNLYSANVTFAGWIYPTNTTQPGAAGLIFCRDGSGTTSGLGYNPAGTQLGYTWNDDGGTYGWNSGLIPPVNQWSFVALVVSPTNATLYLYHDGGQTSARVTHTHAASAFSGETRLGNDALSSGRTFKGRLCEVTVFNRALTGDQIGTLYQAAAGWLYQFTLASAWDGARLTLTWPGTGRLLEATNLAGPWTLNAAAVSPAVIAPDGAAKFFQIIAP